jgi:TonB family protein
VTQPPSAAHTTPSPAVAAVHTARPQRASPPPPRNRFEAIDRVIRSAAVATTALGKAQAAKKTGGPGGPLLTLAPGRATQPTFSIGIGGGGALERIGSGGLSQSGQLKGGGYGREGAIGGKVVGAVRPAGIGLPKTQAGVIDRDAVAKVISAHLAEVQRCYEASLLLEGGSGGRLSVEWTISASGAVTNAKVLNSSLKQASVPGCVVTAIKRWTFPKPRGGAVVISYPFVFQSSDYR